MAEGAEKSGNAGNDEVTEAVRIVLARRQQRAAAQLPLEALAGEHQRRQSWIATAVIILYVGVIAVATVAYLLAAWAGTSGAPVASAATQIRDMANTLVLPVVTLVLGYYFGRRSD